jgi:hypothetical protein
MDLLLSIKKRFKGAKIFLFVKVKTGSKKTKSRKTKARVLKIVSKNLFIFETGGNVNR